MRRSGDTVRWRYIAYAFVILGCGASSLIAGEPDGFLVASLQVEPKPWDKEHNFQLLSRYAREAAAHEADIVIACEGFLEGYVGNTEHHPEMTREEYFQVGEELDGPWMRRVAGLARELTIYLGLGFAERRDSAMYNSFVVFGPDGEVVLHYSKTHTAGERFNTPGDELPVVRTPLATFGALICYDRRFPEVARILTLKGAQVLLIPAFGTDGERNEALLRTRAWENSAWVVYVKQNQVLVIDPGGTIRARDSKEGDEIVYCRIEINDDVGGGDLLNRRSPEFYRDLIELSPNQKRTETPAE